MNWLNDLYNIQKQLDAHIQEQHHLQGKNLVEQKILALLVELGELANETRCFKFWSIKPPADQDIILEEYVDGIHFLLSLGIDLGFTDVSSITLADEDSDEEVTATTQFLTVYEVANLFKQDMTYENYIILFTEFLKLGNILGFGKEEIHNSYLKKNEINYQRQKDNY